MGLRILCAGVEQSDYERWGICPIFDLDEKVDGIVYTIPNYETVNVPLLISLLEKGVPVFILKMRTENPRDIEEISRAIKPGVELYIGDHYRLEPGAVALSDSIGMCGRIAHASWRASIPMDKRAEWMDNYAHMTLMDLCYHYFMTLSGYIGSFSGTVFAHSYAPPWMSDKGYLSLVLRTHGGVTVDVSTNWGTASAQSSFFGECTLEGSLGRLWTNGAEAKFISRSLNTSVLECPPTQKSGWAASVDGFCEYLAGGSQSSLISFDRYRDVFNFQHAALISSEENRSVTF